MQTRQETPAQSLHGDEDRFRRLIEIGIALSAEKNLNRLLEIILLEAKSICRADGGTVYLHVPEEQKDSPHRIGKLDRRSGGDRRQGRDLRQTDLAPQAVERRSGHDRRTWESRRQERNRRQTDLGSPAVEHRSGRKRRTWESRRQNRDRRHTNLGPSAVDHRSGAERRQAGGRRGRHEQLRFAIVRNDSLDIAMGGTTGKEVPFPPLTLYDPKTGEPNFHNVATYAAITGKSVNIPDAYTAEGFDFSGTREFDKRNRYRSTSFLTIPLKNKTDDMIGVLQLINASDPKTGQVVPFDPNLQQLIESLASQAAVAIDNQMLFDAQKKLFGSFIQLIATAIDEKSPYTGEHCKRVPHLTEMLAEAACEAKEGPFKNFSLSEDERFELHVAAWLHDCGKITTPEYVVDKATKLETIHDRIEAIDTRFEVVKRDVEIAYLKTLAEAQGDKQALKKDYEARLARLDSDRAFVRDANVGGEFMAPDRIERIKRIAKMRWRSPDGKEQDLLSEDEVNNLCIGRGTLTDEERTVISNHVVVTIQMLEKLPFPKGMTRVPEFAGGHHEKMDGSGYPRGLTREQMSIPARMIAIADIFEALTAGDRPYKKAKRLSEAMRIMGEMKRDNHIDPDLFDLFVQSNLHRTYAERFLKPEQIDEVDHDEILGGTSVRAKP